MEKEKGWERYLLGISVEKQGIESPKPNAVRKKRKNFGIFWEMYEAWLRIYIRYLAFAFGIGPHPQLSTLGLSLELRLPFHRESIHMHMGLGLIDIALR